MPLGVIGVGNAGANAVCVGADAVCVAVELELLSDGPYDVSALGVVGVINA